MYLHNITIICEDEISQIIHTHLNNYLEQHLQSKSKKSIQMQLLELCNSPNEGKTFCLQIVAPDEFELNLFNQQSLDIFIENLLQQHHGKVLNFASTMKFITAPISL